ncbi:MAG: MBL fold metallo-hydrolase [Candidatus Thorarchaeota archaeon]
MDTMFFSSRESEKIGKEIKRNLYYFSENQILDCNQYIIQNPDTKELVLFDAGNGISLKGLFKGIERCNLDPYHITKVILTHEHVDHTLGLYPLVNILSDNPPEILAYGETAKILREGDVSRIFPGDLGLKPSMFGVEIIPLNVTDLKNTKSINLFSEYEFEIHYTPGHSLGSISYYEPRKKILISGDLVFRAELVYNIGSFGRYDFPGGSLNILKKSIEYVSKLDVLSLLPGHMGIVEEEANFHIALAHKTIQTLYY